MATKDVRQKALAPWSVLLARRWGGVVEHPWRSRLWGAMDLPDPGHTDSWGFTTVVDQLWFGHRALKRTKLYICGMDPAELEIPLTFNQVETDVQKMGRAERESTPRKFAEYLLDVAKNCSNNALPRVA